MYQELDRLPALRNLGAAIADYIKALNQGDFKRTKGNRWICADPTQSSLKRPLVSIKVQHAKTKTIVIRLYGMRHEYEAIYQADLTLQPDLMGYMRCSISSPRQLAAAVRYIEHAFVLHQLRIRPVKVLNGLAEPLQQRSIRVC